MDLGQIIYAIAILGYFLYQVSRKKKSQESGEAEETNQDPPQKGLTFEELLKEIRNAQNPPAPEIPKELKPEPVRPVASETLEPRNERKKRFEPVEELDDEARYYEGTFGSKTKPNPYQALANKTFTEPEIMTFKSYELPSKKINPYADLLKNPRSLKESVIVSEILRPKYF